MTLLLITFGFPIIELVSTVHFLILHDQWHAQILNRKKQIMHPKKIYGNLKWKCMFCPHVGDNFDIGFIFLAKVWHLKSYNKWM